MISARLAYHSSTQLNCQSCQHRRCYRAFTLREGRRGGRCQFVKLYSFNTLNWFPLSIRFQSVSVPSVSLQDVLPVPQTHIFRQCTHYREFETDRYRRNLAHRDSHVSCHSSVHVLAHLNSSELSILKLCRVISLPIGRFKGLQQMTVGEGTNVGGLSSYDL